MKCLVKIYDTEQVNNLVSVFAFRPQKIVFLYDKKSEIDDLSSLEKACTEELPNLNFEFFAIDTQNLDNIKNSCKKIIQNNQNCIFDITGGEELSAIGAYLACVEGNIPVFKLDLDMGKLINVYNCNLLSEEFKLPNLNLKNILMSKGAVLEQGLHPVPLEKQFDTILAFCQEVFKNIDLWKDLCSYIQYGMKDSDLKHKGFNFECVEDEKNVKSKFPSGTEFFLKRANELGMIKDLKLSDKKVCFKFENEHIKKYMTDFGSWLELYTYITLFKSGLFEDLKMSVKIVWGGARGNKNFGVVNEIDITFFSGITPVFVSCKISCPNSEAIQELSLYANYFGGKRSKCILVTTADVKTESPKILKRAEEMGVSILDYSYIKSENLVKGINKILNNLR